jgi:hypothetical protein
MSRNQAEDIKRQLAHRERELSRRQVQRVMKLDPAVWVLLDTLIDDTGLSVSDLLGESLAIAAASLREKHKPKVRRGEQQPSAELTITLA